MKEPSQGHTYPGSLQCFSTVWGKHSQLDTSYLLVSEIGMKRFSNSFWAQSPFKGLRRDGEGGFTS